MLPFTQIAVLITILFLTFLYYLSTTRGKGGRAQAPSLTHAKESAAARGAILFCGHTGSGKTALLHQLAFGGAPQTLSSSLPLTVHKRLHRDEGSPQAPKLKLMDCPGSSQFRKTFLRLAGECSACVLVVDACGGGDSVKATAAVLYDLFTDPGVLRGAPRVLVAANKGDLPGAEAGAQALKGELERELERLKKSRMTVATAEGGGEGSSGTSGGDTAPIYLGTVGEAFSFARDAPLPMTWGTCVAVGKDTRLGDVEAFISGT
jgi:signal recognition particle receptor subunit beta